MTTESSAGGAGSLDALMAINDADRRGRELAAEVWAEGERRFHTDAEFRARVEMTRRTLELRYSDDGALLATNMDVVVVSIVIVLVLAERDVADPTKRAADR